MSIRGITFNNQLVAAADHGTLYKRMFTDGRLKGCAISSNSSAVSIASGYLIIAGRLVQNTSTVSITTAASGSYCRLKAVIDTSLPSTADSFQQVSFAIDYAASVSGFPALTQNDINAGTGNIYEAALCIMRMSGSTAQAFEEGPFDAKLTAEEATTAETAATATTATSATKLATARNINVSDADGTNTGTAASFNGTSAVTIKLPATIKANIVGALTGLASTATKLATARTIRTNLASTTAASFDGSANVTPGVTGTLPAANGGTGQTSLPNALDALVGSRTVVDGTPTDDTTFLSENSNGNGTYWPRKMVALYNYIKTKLTASDIPALPASKISSGTFDAARIPNISAAKITSGTLPAARGGTGQGTLVDAMHDLINSMSEGDATPTDASHYIAQSTTAGSTNYYLRPFSTLYTYIKTKLTASDIPALPASKITSGTFATARIADGAVTNAKIADGAVTNAKVASGVSAAKVTGASGTLGAFTARRIYIGTSAPGSSVGEQGDIYIVYS